MTLLAVFAEQVLSRLLVIAQSAPYCRWTMHRLDVSRLLPFAGKVLAAVFDGAHEPSVLALYAISRLLVSVPLVNGATFKLKRAGFVRLRLHRLRQSVFVLPGFLVWDLRVALRYFWGTGATGMLRVPPLLVCRIGLE
jgi:hypothetical protein